MGRPGTSWWSGGGGVGGQSVPGTGSGMGTNDSWPIWTGKVDNPGDTLTFTIDGKSYEVTPDANGVWDFTPPQALDNGSHEISVTAKNPLTGEEETIADDWDYHVDADSVARQNDYLRHKEWEEGGRDAFHEANAGTPAGTPAASGGGGGGGGGEETPPRPTTGGGGGGGGPQTELTTGGGGGGGGGGAEEGGGGGGGQPPSEKGNQPRM